MLIIHFQHVFICFSKGLRFVKQSQKVYRVNGLTLVLHRTLSSQSPAIPFCKQIFKTSESDNTKSMVYKDTIRFFHPV